MKLHDGHIPFKTHVGWHGTFLKGCHVDGLDQNAYDESVRNFRTYVVLVSNGKMVGRLNMGEENKQANFAKVITAQQKQFTLGTFEEPIEGSLQKRQPTDEQSTFVKHFLLNFPEATEEDCDRRSRLPSYDLEGRKRFHAILRSVVQGTSKALRALKSCKEKLAKHGWEVSNDDVEEVKRLTNSADAELSTFQGLLDLFGKTVPGGPLPLLDIHLKWLCKVADASSRLSETSITPLSDFKIPESTTNPAASESDPTASTSDPTASTSDPATFASDSTTQTLAAMLARTQLSADEEAQIKDEFDFLTDHIADTQDAKKGGCPAAAKKWLQLIGLHEVGLRRASLFHGGHENKSVREYAESQHILRSNIAVIDIKRLDWTDERTSLNNTLQALVQDWPMEEFNFSELSAKLSAQERKKQKEALKRLNHKGDKQKKPLTEEELDKRRMKNDAEVDEAVKNFMEDTTATGTYHCEQIIMGALVVMAQPGVSEHLTDDFLRCNNIFALKTDLLKMLKGLIPVLCVSKPCCPGCWIVFKMLAQKTSSFSHQGRIAMPGYHTKWYSHSLPPFLPTEYVEVIVRETEQKAKEKLRRLQNQVNKEKYDPQTNKRSSSEGQQSNPPSAGPTPEPKRQRVERTEDDEMV